MSVLSMTIIVILLLIFIILFTLFLVYKQKAFNCDQNPAIRCWGDWECLDPTNKRVKAPTLSNLQNVLLSEDGTPGICSTANPIYYNSDGTPNYNLFLKNCQCAGQGASGNPANATGFPGVHSGIGNNTGPLDTQATAVSQNGVAQTSLCVPV